MQGKEQYQKCRIMYKGVIHDAEIIEQKLDKFKVRIFNSKKNVICTDWYSNKEIKRLWI